MNIITLEYGTIIGGLGSAVLEFAADHGYKSEVTRLGVPDHFIGHGTVEELQKLCGYDKEGVKAAAMRLASHLK